MCYILLGFFKLSIFQVVPQLNSTTFDLLPPPPPPKKKQLVSFYSLRSLLFTHILNMSHVIPYDFFHKSCNILKQCLHDISFNQIDFLFPGTHKLFRGPLFDILTSLLSTHSVFLQIVVFFFDKSIFDIV